MLIANIGIWSRKNALRKMRNSRCWKLQKKLSDVTAQDALKNSFQLFESFIWKKMF